MRFLKSLLMSNIILFAYTLSTTVYAEESVAENFNECLYKTIKTVNKNKTLAQIEALCEQVVIEDEQGDIALGLISERLIKEKKSAFNPYVMTPHKINYILPVLYTNDINNSVYDAYVNWADNLESIEAKFQLSIKVPLAANDIFRKGDGVYFAFTLESWWQVYADDISKPFRETNYQPEFFYFTPINWHPFAGNTNLVLGFEHQSNGRSELLSRSWNRVYLNFLFEKNNFVFSFRPWYRIPEGDNVSSSIDDNPDIEKYMGHFELGAVYKLHEKYEFSIQVRENFSEHKGSVELGFTFPLWGKLRGYTQYFNGYGESLIDYNHSQHRIGIGLALNDIL